ncbi:MAG: hypothetical protein MUF71_16630 [Candidatus Kapabacteria bacterium]|jgi:hypothetical protein|nr:hypothetical protein [Candidatus Kapabacteria bacterium]
MTTLAVDMRHSIAALVMEKFIPMLLIASAVRGLFLTTWLFGTPWAMPTDVLWWYGSAAAFALVLYIVLPKLDAVVRVSLALAPVFVWLALTMSVSMPDIFKNGALESLTERTLGYMMAIPYGLVYMRYVQFSTTLAGKITAALFAALFLLWGIAAAVLREQAMW